MDNDRYTTQQCEDMAVNLQAQAHDACFKDARLAVDASTLAVVDALRALTFAVLTLRP